MPNVDIVHRRRLHVHIDNVARRQGITPPFAKARRTLRGEAHRGRGPARLQHRRGGA
ncbi:Hypothetical protein A7982_05793 [Minicystis rosea]|nr:Hypothetical protein A7982_05793 [Minicystis rosea]